MEIDLPEKELLVIFMPVMRAMAMTSLIDTGIGAVIISEGQRSAS
jgi:hypothetical protein